MVSQHIQIENWGGEEIFIFFRKVIKFAFSGTFGGKEGLPGTNILFYFALRE